MPKLTVMTPQDVDKVVEVDVEQEFSRLMHQNYAAYRIDPDTGDGEQIREFDPDAAEILLAPALVGG